MIKEKLKSGFQEIYHCISYLKYSQKIINSKLLISVFIVISISSGFFEFFLPFVLKTSLDNYIPSKEMNGLFKIVSLSGIFLFLRYVLGFIHSLLMHIVNLIIIPETQKNILSKIMKPKILSLNHSPYEVAFVLTRDCSAIVMFYFKVLSKSIVSFIVIVCGALFIIRYDVVLFLIMIMSEVFHYSLLMFFHEKRFFEYERLRESHLHLMSFAQDVFKKINHVFIHCAEKFFQDKIGRVIDQKVRVERRLFWIDKLIWFFEQMLYFAFKLFMVYYCGRLLFEGILSQGEIAFLGVIILKMNAMILDLNLLIKSLPDSSVIFKRFQKNMIDDDTQAQDQEKMADFQELMIKDLTYQIDGNTIFESFDLKVEKGEKIAVTGPNGSGKTTLFNLLLGLIGPDSGRIEVNSIPLNRINLKSWYGLLSVCPQDSGLIKGISLDDNISLNKKKNEFHYLYQKLLNWSGIDKWNTANIYKNDYSSGEMKKMMLLRAVFCQSQLILFDEPESSLNDEDIKKLMDLILETDSTVIIMTHSEMIKKMVNRCVDLSFLY